jgi:hypothetical protein
VREHLGVRGSAVAPIATLARTPDRRRLARSLELLSSIVVIS